VTGPRIRVLAADDQRVVREGLAMLLGLLPDVEVVGTAADGEEVLALAAELRAGALGYLTKDAGAAEIQQALHRVAGGQAALDPAVQRHLVEAIAGETAPGPAAQPDGLTPREAEVLTLIAGGLSNAEIAKRLFVSEATVKSHVNHMLPKIGARDRAQAVAYAYRRGLAPR